MKKYEFTGEVKVVYGITLHRIRAVVSFGSIIKGELGGWIQKEGNLSQNSNAWVYDNAKVYGDAKVFDNAKVYGDAKVFGDANVYGDAKVYGNAKVYGDAEVYGNAKVCGNAEVYDNAWVYDNAKVYGDAKVYGNAKVYGDAEVYGNADYIVFKNWWSSGRYFTWTRSNNKWTVGCFFGTGAELIAKAYQDSKKSGREYERIVKYVESILADENNEKTTKQFHNPRTK